MNARTHTVPFQFAQARTVDISLASIVTSTVILSVISILAGFTC